MILNGDNQSNLASAMDIAEKTLSEKINEKSQFNLNELRFIVKRYNLSADEIKEIFFN